MAQPQPQLPHTIIVDLLSRLPVKSLMRFRCVCKPWNSLISDPQFVKIHLSRSTKGGTFTHGRVLLSTFPLQSIDYESAAGDNDAAAAVMFDNPSSTPDHYTEIVGSCNGLICLVLNSHNLILWNPSTRAIKELPKPSVAHTQLVSYGFGYGPSIDDYKVVRVPHSGTCSVFELKTNSWRKIRDTNPSSILTESGIYCNGALHWLARREFEEGILNVVISFDLVAEEFQEFVPLPDNFRTSKIHDFRVFGEYLAIQGSNFDIEIWVMKEYGVEESWTKLVNISWEKAPLREDWLKPMCLSKNDEVLMDVDGRGLIMYNLKDDTFRNLKIGGVFDWFLLTVYGESLVSLSSDGNHGADEQHRAQPKRREKRKRRMGNKNIIA